MRERTRGSVQRRHRPSGASPSIEFPNDPDQLSLDAHIVIELRRVGRVGRLQSDLVLLLEEALQGDGVLLDLGHDDVAVAGRRLRADEDEVAIRDVGVRSVIV